MIERQQLYSADGCVNNIKFRNYIPIQDLFIMTGKRPLKRPFIQTHYKDTESSTRRK